MAATRLYIVDANSIMKLLTHYTEGELPLDSELLELQLHPQLNRMICLLTQSSEWPVTTELTGTGELWPLTIRYEGRHTMSWTDKASAPVWSDEEAEAPANQS